MTTRPPRARLFRKYVGLIMGVVSAALIASGGLEIWFSYRESLDYLIRIQREQAQTAATRIGQFVREIEGQLGWTTQLPWSAATLDQRRFDALRLLRQVPAVTELAQFDATGAERLKVSRLAMDVVGSPADMSREPRFAEAVANRVYYGPVYFRRESEPYMTLSVAGNRRDAGVSAAEVNLKFIWDVVSQIQVGSTGFAYVIDAQGRLIAHPDISLVLRNTDMARLEQVQAARRPGGGALSEDEMIARDLMGRRVITAHATIPALNWHVFVEQPLGEALTPLIRSATRTGILLLVGLGIALLAGLYFVRRMVGPIQALQAGAAEIGRGELGRRISVKTGDELEGLANQFNDMAGRLQESYATLERKVEDRTRELTESLEQQTATANVLKVISRSTFELEPVLNALLKTAARLCAADKAVVFRAEGGVYHIAANYRFSEEFQKLLAARPIVPGRETMLGRVALEGQTVHIPDCLADPDYTWTEGQALGDYRALLGVPLLRSGVPIGVFVLARATPDGFTDKQIELVTTFADQAVIAIENVRLFQEVEARTRELTESLEHQTASADILRVISGSPTDVQPVFDVIAERAKALCGAVISGVARFDGEWVHLMAYHGVSHEADQAMRNAFPMRPTGASITARAIRHRMPVQIADVTLDPDYDLKGPAALAGYRSNLGVPMLKDGRVIGSIAVCRAEPGPFPDKQIQLLQTFADQAVIAIENVRLFRELQEALAQQTTSAEILSVISNSVADTTPVFEKILQSCKVLFGGDELDVLLVDEQGLLNIAAYLGQARDIVAATFPAPVERTPAGQAIRERRVMHWPDLVDGTDVPGVLRKMAKLIGYRSMLFAPMLWNERGIGAIGVARSTGPFKPSELALAQTFADQAVIAIQNARLVNETKEALAHQTASADILRAISSSPTDVQPVFEAIVSTAVRHLGCDIAIVQTVSDDTYSPKAMATPAGLAPVPGSQVMPVDPQANFPSRAIASKTMLHVRDWTAVELPPHEQVRHEQLGLNSTLYLPLLRGDGCVGVLVLGYKRANAFNDKTIALAESFRDQALIAVENARLFNETKEALEQQTAIGKILQVIAASPTDIRPMLQAVAESACEVCNAYDGAVLLRQGDDLLFSAHHGPIPIGLDKWPLNRNWTAGRAVIDRTTVHVHDLQGPEGDEFSDGRAFSIKMGHRTIVSVPLLREDEAIGAIVLRRKEAHPFTDKQIALLRTFADQSIIAINNVRLFEEVRQRTRDLGEALEQQTATANVLKVISRSTFELEPVLTALLETAARLCGADKAVVFRADASGSQRIAASFRFSEEFTALLAARPVEPGRETMLGRVALEGQTVHIPDCLADPDYTWTEGQALGGYRALLGVPLLRSGMPIGVFVLARATPDGFTDKQIELVTTFADQAVIAIENVRLFQEVEARTRDLTEALEQQTATSEVLNVISRSPSEIQPVFDAIVRSGLKLFPDAAISIAVPEGDMVKAVAVAEPDAARAEAWRRRFPFPLTREYMHSAVILDGKAVDIPDVRDAPVPFAVGSRNFLESGYRAVTIMPMMRGDSAIGALSVVRVAPGPLSDGQREILRTFADQAVIAIENTRLFQELEARTRELARSVEELRALGEVSQAVNSTLDIATVLDTIVAKAVQISGVESGAIYVFSDYHKAFRMRASYGTDHDLDQALRRQKLGIDTPLGDAARRGEPLQIQHLGAMPPGPVRDLLERGGYQALLIVPLIGVERTIGALVIRRRDAGGFPERTVDLLRTFAAQSVLAIQNARLFGEIREKSRQLEVASQHKSQFLANMSHELRTPLNAILGYTELIVDSIYGEVPAKVRGVLERVQSNGKHLLGLINDVLDLSKIEAGQLTLTLSDYAVQGVVQSVVSATESLARNKGLDLRSSVASGLPTGHGDERRLTQVLLNLVGNAIKFTERGSVEIIASAGGERFRIDVRDTGPGIAEADQQRIFEEFQQVDNSNTRGKGGTGLGLAISRRIVALHGGAISVQSAPGAGSTFTIDIPIRLEASREAA